MEDSRIYDEKEGIQLAVTSNQSFVEEYRAV